MAKTVKEWENQLVEGKLKKCDELQRGGKRNMVEEIDVKMVTLR